MSMRETLRKCGIKPSRSVREHMVKERRRGRLALVRIAGWHQDARFLLLDTWTRSIWEHAEFYDVRIPRSLRREFAEWKRANAEAVRRVINEFKTRGWSTQ